MSPKDKKPRDGASTIWGGRFDARPDALMERINASVHFDRALYAQDIASSVAHARMLAACGIITDQDARAITDGLGRIRTEIEEDRFDFRTALEDIHMNIESRLGDLVGDPARRLHTARSRNDQVATDIRLWVRDAIDRIDEAVRQLQAVLIGLAEDHADTVMPGFTHLQTAQPVTFGHHMLAYVEMLGRDRSRFSDARARLNECPLGAAALAGTSFPIDRHMTAEALGFRGPMCNSLDAVSDRDFALEFLSGAAICATHLSRLAEEIVIWMSAPFGFLDLPDGFTTGSSIMPQKRNPDAAELVRAKPGRIIGALTGLLVVMKGLPMTYGKDMQEDKEPVFDAAETLMTALAVMTGMMAGARPRPARLRVAAGDGYATATDLADWLVRVLGMPFRDAHHVTGALVRRAEQAGKRLEELSLAEMQAVEGAMTDAVFDVLGVDNAVASRTSFGGTAPENVKVQAADARRRHLGDGSVNR